LGAANLEADVFPSASVFGEADGDVPHGYRNTDAMKAFKTTELKMLDIVRLSSILTQKLAHFHI
jgi:hypothetical protein